MAISLNSSLAGYGYNNLGLIYFDQGRLEEAIAEFKKAIQARPLEPSPFFNLGNVYEKKGEIDLSIAYMEMAIHADPGYFEAYKSLRMLYQRKGLKKKSQGADKLYRKHVPGAKPFSDENKV